MNSSLPGSTGLIVSGTHSGVGKSSIVIGLLRLLKRRGTDVKPFKAGPDFIDPQHHVRACGKPGYNLDPWMTSPDYVRKLYAEVMGESGFAVVEGMMGLFDGVRPTDDEGSPAALAKLLGLPVLLVFDGQAMARSSAALVKGFATFDAGVKVFGAIANRVNGARHADMIRQAIESETGVKFLGNVPQNKELEIKSRHLGLQQGCEQDASLYDRWADHLSAHVDIDDLPGLASGIKSRATNPESRFGAGFGGKFRVAVARDEAFQFVYSDTLDFFRSRGGEIIFFSPLGDERLPSDADWIYLPGGYPELFAGRLSENAALWEELNRFVEAGGPVIGECGGLMVLGKYLTDEAGTKRPMAGVFDFTTSLRPGALTLGYRELKLSLEEKNRGAITLRGHEFHYSGFADGNEAPLFNWRGADGIREGKDGYRKNNCFAFYTHLYWPAAPDWLDYILNLVPGHGKQV